MTAGVYLLHFERAAPWRASSPMRHYVGRSRDIEARIEAHRDGRGGRFTASMRALGIRFELVRTWPGNTWENEKRIKGRGGRRHCPVCREARS